MEAKDRAQLASLLHSQGLILVRAVPQEKKNRFNFSIPDIGGISISEKMFFTRNLQVMISAGLSIPRALDIISCQVKSKTFKNALCKPLTQQGKGKSYG